LIKLWCQAVTTFVHFFINFVYLFIKKYFPDIPRQDVKAQRSLARAATTTNEHNKALCYVVSDQIELPFRISGVFRHNFAKDGPWDLEIV
jgi:hypothetical protein